MTYLSKFWFTILAFAGVFLASNRLFLQTKDTEAYIDFYNNSTGTLSELLRFEPAFNLLVFIGNRVGASDAIFIFIIACIGVGTKHIAIYKYAPHLFLSLLIYYSKFFILQDMIQIRAGVAAGIFLLSIKYINERNLKSYFVYIFFAVMFHYSAIVYLIVYFICNPKLAINKFISILLLIVCFSIVFDLNSFLQNIGLDTFEKFDYYINSSSPDDGLIKKFINLELILNTLVILLLYVKRLKLSAIYPYYDVWLKILIASISSSIIFYNTPVLSFRIAELLGVVSIFIYPLVIYAFRQKLYGYMLLLTIFSSISYNYYALQGMII